MNPVAADEYSPYFGRYIALVPPGDLVAILEEQAAATLHLLRGVDEAGSLFRYEAGKWSVKETLGHLMDAERIFAYRALRMARADATPLASFEQDGYVRAAGFDAVAWRELLEEFESVRRATVWQFRHFTPEAWLRRGTASGCEFTARALGYTIAGHELHHRTVLKECYELGR